jgi:putative transposase
MPNDTQHKHCKRYNTPGHSHFLTFSCFHGQPFLTRQRACQWLVNSITAAREQHQFRLIAWVFMPEHVHLLIHPRQKSYSISRILSTIKLPVTIKAKNWILENAPAFLVHMLDEQPNGTRAFRFWQRGGGHDRNIWTPEELWEKIHYIHHNPVRRKLVPRATDWHWSSAADYAHLRTGPLPVDNHDLPWLPA